MQVITGLLIHQTRGRDAPSCNLKFSHLQLLCTLTDLERQAALEGTSSSGPFGMDPTFNALAPQYNARLEGHQADYYNVSTAAGERTMFGQPFGLFSQPLSGTKLGYPVVVGVRSPHCSLTDQPLVWDEPAIASQC